MFRSISQGSALATTLLVTAVLSTIIVYVHLFGPSAEYSDYSTHVTIASEMVTKGIQTPHFLFHGLVALVGTFVGYKLGTIIVVAISQVALAGVLFELYRRELLNWLQGGMISVIGLTLSTMVIAPINFFTFPHIFLGYLAPVTHHNPTIQIVKPLALLAFLLSADLLTRKRSLSAANLIALFVVCIAMTLAKPSFTTVLLPSIGVYWLVFMRGTSFRLAFTVGLAAGIGSLAVLAWQLSFMYGLPDMGSIMFSPFSVVLARESSIPWLVLKYALSLAFPAYVTALLWKDIYGNRRLVFAWIAFVISLAYLLLFAETGTRLVHGNFGWGVLLAQFNLFVVTIIAFFMMDRQGWRWVGGTVLLSGHIVGGIIWYLASANALGSLCGGWGSWCW